MTELDTSNLNDNNISHRILSHVPNKIESLISKNSEYKSSEKNNVLSFICEHLKLCR